MDVFSDWINYDSTAGVLGSKHPSSPNQVCHTVGKKIETLWYFVRRYQSQDKLDDCERLGMPLKCNYTLP